MAQQQQQTDIRLQGRLVGGSLYKARDKDGEGRPLTIKNGPDAGKPRVDYFIAVAVPKQPGQTHWAQTEWGQKIWGVGHTSFPQAAQAPGFAWKVEDGDSQTPNMKGRKPCDNEGWRGHWVVKMSGGYAPKVYVQPQAGVLVEHTTPDAIKCGYWVDVVGNVASNQSTQRPGVYVNHSLVLFVRPDTEIMMGPDAATAFAGAAVSAALPNAPAAYGAPLPGMPAPAPAVPAAPIPSPGAYVTPMPAAYGAPLPGVPAPVPAVPPATYVAPNPGVLMPPVPAAPAAALPPAPTMFAPSPHSAAGPALTPKGAASGFTYAQYRAANWTDEMLRAQGLIV